MQYITFAIPVVIAIVASLTDVIQPYIAGNPTLALLLGAVATILALLKQSPLPPKP